MRPDTSSTRKLLFDFSVPGSLADWSAVDDVVMGGVSRSALHGCGDGHASFEGLVSLANGGGFASVRCRPLALGLPGATVCSIEVCGDGRRYKLNLRTDDTFDGVNYQIGFSPPAGEWAQVRLPLAAFAPSWRGRPVPDAPPLDPARIRQVGLMIADRQAGTFRLFIRRIELMSAADED
ncbi:CIA30 family protein [Rhodocyclaceae bacterium SMB388]